MPRLGPPAVGPSSGLARGIKLGLSRASRLLMPIPQTWKAVHIAGTNGKGSVAFYLSHMLAQAGVRTGVFTSPHLIHPRESIKCVRASSTGLVTVQQPDAEQQRASNSKDTIYSPAVPAPFPIARAEYDAHIETVRQSAATMIQSNASPTEFEVLTTAAFSAFAGSQNPFAPPALHAAMEAPVEVGVIECGVGGAEDATNAMSASKACTVITSISLDHEKLLGGNLVSIARAKAGIMRPGVPCFAAAPHSDEVRRTLRDEAERIGAPLTFVSPLSASKIESPQSTTNSNKDQIFPLPSVFRAMAPHQLLNLTLALKAFEAAVPEKAAALLPPTAEGGKYSAFLGMFSSISPPGRLQHVRLNWRSRQGLSCYKHPSILVDGAHNVEGLEALCEYVDLRLRKYTGRSPKYAASEPVIWILATTRDRDYTQFIKAMGIRPWDTVYYVTFPPVETMPWVQPQHPLALMNAVQCMRKCFHGQIKKAHGIGPRDVFFPPKYDSRGSIPDNDLLDRILEDIVETKDYKRCKGRVVVTGSLYLVSWFLRHFADKIITKKEIDQTFLMLSRE